MFWLLQNSVVGQSWKIFDLPFVVSFEPKLSCLSFVTVQSKPINLKPEIFSLQQIASCIRPHLCAILQKLWVVIKSFLHLVQMQILVLFNFQVFLSVWGSNTYIGTCIVVEWKCYSLWTLLYGYRRQCRGQNAVGK